MFILDSNDIKDYYDATIKIRKNGEIIVKAYDNPIIHKKDNIVSSWKADPLLFMDQFERDIYDYRERKISKKKLEDKKSIDTKIDIRSDSEESSNFYEIRKDNLARTRNLLIDYACENADKFKTFITLTFNDDIKDIDKANKVLNKFLTSWRRDMKNQDREFYYMGVPEYQKSGRVHYHILTSLMNDIDIPRKECIKTYNPMKDKWYEHYYYDIPHWSYGYSDSWDIVKNTDDDFNIALYLMKYLYKDLDNRLFGRNKILKSNNLEKPNVYRLKQNSIIYQNAIYYIDNNINMINKRNVKEVEENENALEEKKLRVTYHYRVEKVNDRGYSLKYDVMHLQSQDDYSILEDILKDDIEF